MRLAPSGRAPPPRIGVQECRVNNLGTTVGKKKSASPKTSRATMIDRDCRENTHDPIQLIREKRVPRGKRGGHLISRRSGQRTRLGTKKDDGALRAPATCLGKGGTASGRSGRFKNTTGDSPRGGNRGEHRATIVVCERCAEINRGKALEKKGEGGLCQKKQHVPRERSGRKKTFPKAGRCLKSSASEIQREKG